MGDHLHRRIAYVLIIAFCVVFFWRDLLSMALLGVARWQMDCQIIYREMKLQDDEIVLENALVVDSSSGKSCYQIRSEKIRIAIGWLQKPLDVHIAFVKPHLTLLDPHALPGGSLKKESKWLRTRFSVEDGRIEWRMRDEDPVFGHFNLNEGKLFLDMNGGSMTAALQGDQKKIHCTFDHLNLSPFFQNAPMRGILSGSVSVDLDAMTPQAISGKLILDDAAISMTKGSIGALRIEWEGDYRFAYREWKGWLDSLLTFPDKMKIDFHQGFLHLNGANLDGLDGTFSSNQDVGLRWEVKGPSFSWDGKGFSKSRSANWMESHWSLVDAKGSIRGEELNDRCRWSIVFDQANPLMTNLMQDLFSIEWAGRLEEGVFSARFSWDEAPQFENWHLEEFHGRDLSIRAEEWNFHCQEVHGSLSSDGSAQLTLKDGGGACRDIQVASLSGTWNMQSQKIDEAHFAALVNGLEMQGDFSGTIENCTAEILMKGPWSQYWFWRHQKESQSPIVESKWALSGNWRAFSAQVQALVDGHPIAAEGQFVKVPAGWSLVQGHTEASSLSLVRLMPIFGLDCSGTADLHLDYSDGELKIDAAGSHLLWKANQGMMAIDHLGREEPFEAGVKAVWEKESNQWTVQTSRLLSECVWQEKKVVIEGQIELSGKMLKVCIAKGSYADLEFLGDCLFSLEEKIPFSLQAQKIEGSVCSIFPAIGGRAGGDSELYLSGDLLGDPKEWRWSLEAELCDVQYGALKDIHAKMMADSKEGLIDCSLDGFVAIGNARFPLRAIELRKCGCEWMFDLRVEHQIWDLARLCGSASIDQGKLVFSFDLKKSHLFNSPLQIQECVLTKSGQIESLNCTWPVSWDQLLTTSKAIKEIDSSFESLLRSPVQGKAIIAIDLHRDRASVQVQGKQVEWNGSEIPFSLMARRQDAGWEIEEMQINALKLSCQLQDWKIKQGICQWGDGCDAEISGTITPLSHLEIHISNLNMDLKKVIAPFIWPALEGKLQGKGTVTFDYKGSLTAEADLELMGSGIKNGSFLIENSHPLLVHFSRQQGLLIRGADFQISNENAPLMNGRIGLMQFDFFRKHWVMNHLEASFPSASLPAIRQKISHPGLDDLFETINGEQDLEFTADVDLAADLSTLSCQISDGWIPFLGSRRHLQKVSIHYTPSGMYAALSLFQGGHSLKIGSLTQFEPQVRGRVFLEDEDVSLSERERPLSIDWENIQGQGLTIHSIEGMFQGIEASFHAQNAESLIGSARLDFKPLSEIAPPRLGQIFRELKMGKGYEIKGSLNYDPKNLSYLSFKGLMSGKQCELMGFQIRTLLTQVDIDPSHVHLFEIKASDLAGILKIDDLSMHRKDDASWEIRMPELKLVEFRPSLLQKIGQEVGSIGPLVVREAKIQDLKGNLDDVQSMTAKGELHFINSFKREHTVFDLPSDFFGRIIGLDSELLIPVRGKLEMELKEGRIWLTDLQDAYSEGKRSKFFLVKEGLSPTMDLNGNLQIFVTMKQYVLFKITENFLLTINGTIESPSYHLQKKSKILGL